MQCNAMQKAASVQSELVPPACTCRLPMQLRGNEILTDAIRIMKINFKTILPGLSTYTEMFRSYLGTSSYWRTNIDTST